MSTAAVSNPSLNQQLEQFFHTRGTDLQQLGQALKSGNLAGAQTVYNSIVALGQNGPFASGNPFRLTGREQDFTAVGQALQAGDLAGAQHAFNALKSTFQKAADVQDPLRTNPTSSSGPEIILNLSNSGGSSASPEQITINISPTSGGGEQVALSIGSQGSNPEQVTLNLAANSNEQIVLNLLGAPSATSSSSTSSPASGGLSVKA
jgi:hypothetical protein